MSDEIKWNQEKKERRDKEATRERAKIEIGKVYQAWKTRLLGRNKMKVEDLEAAGDKLRQSIKNALGEFGLMDDAFGRKSMELVEAKLDDIKAALAAGTALSSQTAFVNHITRYLPELPDGQPQTPEVHEFRSEIELMSIPFVDAMTKKPDYVGLVRDENKLYAWFEPDELVLIGAVTSRVGVERLPTIKEVHDAKYIKNRRN